MFASERMFFGCVAAVGSCATLLACSLVYPVSDLEGAPADASAASAESAAPDGGGACSGVGGPAAVRVRFDGGTFCVDSTEVTNAQYAAFLTAKGDDLTGQPPGCAANDYLPSQAWPIAAGDEDQPVTYVDWCDARAFCAWAGKRLCGPRVDAFVTRDEWSVACSHDATRKYPYGDDYDPNACNGDNRIGHTVAVGSLPGCAGGYDGIVDMSGNVSEWVDCAEDAGACFHRGGGYSSTDGATKLACDAFGGIGRLESYSSVGIRCCSD